MTRNMNFISEFSRECEQRLARLGNKIQKMEHSLKLLENKLESIPSEPAKEDTKVEPAKNS